MEDQVKQLLPPDRTLNPNLVQDIINTYERAGFVYQYFGFMNIRSPFVQARLGELPLTPQLFERGVTSTLETYSSVMQAIVNPPDRKGFAPPFYDQLVDLHGTVANLTPNELYDLKFTPYIGTMAIPGWTKMKLREAIRITVVNSGLAEVNENGK